MWIVHALVDGMHARMSGALRCATGLPPPPPPLLLLSASRETQAHTHTHTHTHTHIASRWLGVYLFTSRRRLVARRRDVSRESAMGVT